MKKSEKETTGCAIIGSGNIGTDLMIKIIRTSAVLDVKMMVGIDATSEGLARARRLGIQTSDAGLNGLLFNREILDSIDIVFDATSAKAHKEHAAKLRSAGKIAVDLTPAAVGPYVVPTVNLTEHLDKVNVNMITCGGQATIPMVFAVSRVSDVWYAEMVSSIASRSAGPGTRQNIDEFTQTTARGLEVIGGARRGKAIIILNPAEPPLIMRNTVYTITAEAERDAIRDSIAGMVADMQAYVPGYRLKADPLFEHLPKDGITIPGYGSIGGLKTSILLEVEGAAHYLPSYAGNLDIMTSAAKRVGEMIAERRTAEKRVGMTP